MKNRLIEFVTYFRMSQRKFEINAGLPNGFINNLGDNITWKSLYKIEKAYPELNMEWLKTGEGSMLRPVNQSNVSGDNIVGSKNIGGDNIQGGHITINNSDIDKFIDLFKEKNGQIDKCQNQISKSQEQISIGQEQISKYIEHVDKLLGIIEKLTDAK